MYLRKGDEVIVIAGKDKGKTGTVKEILPNNKIIVEGIALVKKTQKSNASFDGTIIEVERPIDASNVNLYDKKTKQKFSIKVITRLLIFVSDNCMVFNSKIIEIIIKIIKL